jgi:hypothetical protein
MRGRIDLTVVTVMLLSDSLSRDVTQLDGWGYALSPASHIMQEGKGTDGHAV